MARKVFLPRHSASRCWIPPASTSIRSRWCRRRASTCMSWNLRSTSRRCTSRVESCARVDRSSSPKAGSRTRESDRLVAIGATHWAVAGPNPGFSYVDNRPGVADTGNLPPLYEMFGARLRDDGNLEIPELTPELGRNGLHQGPFQVVPETAAMNADREVRPALTGCGFAIRARRSCSGASACRSSRTRRCCNEVTTRCWSVSSCAPREPMTVSARRPFACSHSCERLAELGRAGIWPHRSPRILRLSIADAPSTADTIVPCTPAPRSLRRRGGRRACHLRLGVHPRAARRVLCR